MKLSRIEAMTESDLTKFDTNISTFEKILRNFSTRMEFRDNQGGFSSKIKKELEGYDLIRKK